MLITCHWSATGPSRLRDYHIEYALTGGTIPAAMMDSLLKASSPADVDWKTLRPFFTVWKNVDFATATDYGTYLLNHDPRDGSPNIEIGALCMGGESVSVAGPWGAYPFTIAHAWMAASIAARVCAIKDLDAQGSFSDSAMQNGPLSVVSTHAERAIQTPDGPAANLRPTYGYFIYSGDPDSRWDLSARDPSEAHLLATPEGAYASAFRVAHWIRAQAHAIKAAGISDLWALDKGVTP